MKRAALYARTSTKIQDIDLQLRELRAYATQLGLEVTEYVEAGISSGRVKRPKLLEMMAECRRRKHDVVVVWRYDRFARTTRELVLALEDFRALGIDFVSLREAIDTTTASGRVLFAVTAAFAEFERDVLRERVRAGVDLARRKGKRLGRPRARIPVEAITKAQQLRAGGASWDAISDELGIARNTIRRSLAKWDAFVQKGLDAAAWEAAEDALEKASSESTTDKCLARDPAEPAE